MLHLGQWDHTDLIKTKNAKVKYGRKQRACAAVPEDRSVFEAVPARLSGLLSIVVEMEGNAPS